MGLKTHFSQLDGIRFLAVMMVLFDHWSDYAFGFPMSYLGVCLFFVLSGFLITGILIDAKDKDADLGRSHGFSLKQFYFRRTIRIFPVYYLTLLVAYLLQVQPVKQHPLWHFGYASNIYMALKENWLGVTDHFWSLAVEEQFYLFFPFVILFLQKKYFTSIFIGFIVLSVALRAYFYANGHSWITSYVLMPTCLDAFGLGALLAYFHKQKTWRFWAFCTNKLYLLGSVALYLAVVYAGKQFVEQHNIINVVLLRLVESIFSFFLIANAVYGFSGNIKDILTNPLATYMGKISYGLYIYHNFVYNAYHSSATHPVVQLFNYLGLLATDWLSITLRLLLLTVITVLISSISWYLIEKPINKFKERFSY